MENSSCPDPVNQSKAFPQGGFYIMRSERLYLMCVCHRIGVNGVGPHKHNDWLSFELCADTHSTIIDPGTYCYTGNIEMRRLFRSTAYHNTVVVDGEEQLPIHNSMFALVNPSGDIHVLDCQRNDSFDLLTAEHTGYQRLAEPVVHRRTFYMDKKNHCIDIRDSFRGEGKHFVEFNFHLDTNLSCEIEKSQVFFIKANRPIFSMRSDYSQAAFMVRDGWVSKAYNQKEPALILSWSTTVDAVAGQEISHSFFLNQNLPSEPENNAEP